MDQILVVRGREAARDLRGDVDGFAQRQWAAAEPLAQRLAFEQLHDDERLRLACACVWPNSKTDDDVGMRQRGDRLRFALESSEAIGIAGDGRRQDLDGDVASELESRAR